MVLLITMSTPVNIFSGFLGSGKTTVIKHLLDQVEHPEQMVWLKNEYGDVNIDKLLVASSHVQTKEILNGCLCCVLIGRLGDALQEIVTTYNPKRILIETSGTAYPGPIVWEVEKQPQLYVDSVVTIVDAINFDGYKDKSYAARLQSKVTDVVIINKYPQQAFTDHELESTIAKKIDDIYDLHPGSTKIFTSDGKVNVANIFGIHQNQLPIGDVPLLKPHDHHDDEVMTIELTLQAKLAFKQAKLDSLWNKLKQKNVWRIKGLVNLGKQYGIINWVNGQGTWEYRPAIQKQDNLLTVMGWDLKFDGDDLANWLADCR